MISRGEVGLIIASVGLTAGIFSEELFPTLFLVILLSTVVTPPLVRLVFKQQPEGGNMTSTPQPKEAVHG